MPAQETFLFWFCAQLSRHITVTTWIHCSCWICRLRAVNISTQKTSLTSRTVCHSTVFSSSWLWVLTGYMPIQKNILLTPQSTFMKVSWRTTSELDFCLNQQVVLQAVVPSGCIPALGKAGRGRREWMWPPSTTTDALKNDRLNSYEK